MKKMNTKILLNMSGKAMPGKNMSERFFLVLVSAFLSFGALAQADTDLFQYDVESKLCLNSQGEAGLNAAGSLPYMVSAECTDFTSQTIFGQNLGPFNFRGANFQCATVSRSNFTSTTFRGADLRSAVFTGIVFHAAEFKDARYNSRTQINDWNEQVYQKLGMILDDTTPECDETR